MPECIITNMTYFDFFLKLYPIYGILLKYHNFQIKIIYPKGSHSILDFDKFTKKFEIFFAKMDKAYEKAHR